MYYTVLDIYIYLSIYIYMCVCVYRDSSRGGKGGQNAPHENGFALPKLCLNDKVILI